jgi:uncharacterized protein YndB with AHSA1/START domain
MIDVASQINDVRREVGSRVMEAGEARTTVVAQTYDATIEDVWDACTNPERIPRWFLPVTGDFRLGGRYQIEGNASGTIERCEPPRELAATWEFGGGMSWIELRLSPEAAGGTRFELEHIAHVDDEHWEQFGPGAVGVGWDLALVGFALHLRDPDTAMTPAEGQEWAVSDEGLDFARRSSEQWYEASVAAGTPVEKARAAADRTTAFYTEPART